MNPKIAKAGVPGVPLAALDAITDENTRTVLRALVDGWQVRNGASGNGDNRFITKAELSAPSGASLIGGLAGASGSSGGNGGLSDRLTPSDLNRLINDLQASVIESRLFKALGERIHLIKLNADAAATGVTQEITQRSNSDNAIVQVINTMWAVIGNNQAIIQGGSTVTANDAGAVATNWNQLQTSTNGVYSAIAQEAETRATADGELYAQYTVKIDQNGYVSGYGLASTASNSTPFSEFTVRADRFAIGSPSAPDYVAYVDNYADLTASWIAAGRPDKLTWGYNHWIQWGQFEGRILPNRIALRVPFIVTTTPQVVNGQLAPPGVYIDDAFIRNGVLTTAKIGNAQIKTLSIDGNAVTQPVTATQAGEVRYVMANGDLGVYKNVLSVSVNYGTELIGAEARAIIGFTTQVTNGSGGFWAVLWRVIRDGDVNQVLGSGQQSVENNGVADNTVTATVFENGTSGVRTYTLQVAVWGPDPTQSIRDYSWPDGYYARKAYKTTMYALGAKR